MALAIYGPTGVGKTFTLFTYLTEKKKDVLLCRSLEDLSEYENQTDIIFDDVSFSLSRPELLIHLCDKNFHSSVRILRCSVRLPANVRKWFTHNSHDNWNPLLATQEQQEAINRRLKVVYVDSRKSVLKTIDSFYSSLQIDDFS